MMRNVFGVGAVVTVAAGMATGLVGCPGGQFELVLQNTGTTNPIVGCYLVPRDAKVEDWGPNRLARDAQGFPVPIQPGAQATLPGLLDAGPTYDFMVEFENGVGNPLYREFPVSEDGRRLQFEAGMATSISQDVITAHAALEDSGTGYPSYGIGYNWGAPQP